MTSPPQEAGIAIKTKSAKSAKSAKSPSNHSRITVGLPNLQEQIGMLNRVSGNASDPDLEQLRDLSDLLSDLYTQLQHQGQVTVRRVGGKNQSKVHGGGKGK